MTSLRCAPAPSRCIRQSRRRAPSVRSGRRRRCVRTPPSPRDRRRPGLSICRTAASALRGSCHQWGSYFDASAPERLAGQLDRDLGAEVDDFGVAAAVGDDLIHPGIEVVAAGEDQLRPGRALDVGGPGLVVVRVGVRLEDLVDLDRFAADVADEVSELGRRRHHVELFRAPSPDPPPHPAARSARAPSAAATTAMRGTFSKARTAATTMKAPPATQAIVAPGGALVLTESQRPTVPSRATRQMLSSCQLKSRSVKRRAVTAGTRKSAVTSSAPTTVRAAVLARAIRPSSTASKTCGLGPPESASVGSKPMRSQCCPIRALARRVAAAAAAASAEIAAVDQEQAAEQQRLDIRARAEDVAGEDHAPARQPTRTRATTASSLVRRPRSAEAPTVKASAAPKAPRGAAKPKPSARTSPGKAAVPTAWRRRRGRAARSRCRAGPRGRRGSAPRSGHAGRREAGMAQARESIFSWSGDWSSTRPKE